MSLLQSSQFRPADHSSPSILMSLTMVILLSSCTADDAGTKAPSKIPVTLSSTSGTSHETIVTNEGIDETFDVNLSWVTPGESEDGTQAPSKIPVIISNTSDTTLETVVTNKGIGKGIGKAFDVNLSWVAPSEREDGSGIPLSEISGYRIYYGPTPRNYQHVIDINDRTATEATITVLPSARHYFSVTTYDMDGRESRYSAEFTVNNKPLK